MALARDRVILTTSYATAASTNYTPVTGLSFAATAARTYHCRIVCMTSQAATTTGVRFGLSGNPTTAPTYAAMIGLNAVLVGSIGGGGNTTAALGLVTTASTTGGYTAQTDSVATTGGSLYVVEYMITPSVTQILQVECGPEAAAVVTVLPGSYVEWELLV